MPACPRDYKAFSFYSGNMKTHQTHAIYLLQIVKLFLSITLSGAPKNLFSGSQDIFRKTEVYIFRINSQHNKVTQCRKPAEINFHSVCDDEQ